MSQQNIGKPRGMRQLYALGKKRAIDLSLSENPLGCSPLVAKKLEKNNFAFNDYPDPNGIKLKAVISEKLSCKPTNIFVCNGSEAIINTIPKVLAQPGDEAIVPTLTFPMFSICSELAGLNVKFASMTDKLGIDLAAIMRLINQNTRLIFVCNPNNPTGSVISKEKLTAFIQKVPDRILVVVDEANIEFGGESVMELTKTKPNVVLLRTLSKGFGLASLRIGFAVANEQLIAKLEEETPVFPVSGLSEELSVVALQDEAFITKTKQFIDEQRTRIEQVLTELGFTVFTSEANNLFVKLPEMISAETFWTAVEEADISLVKGSSFLGFDDTFFRVSPRLEKINRLFLNAVTKIVRGATI